MNRILIKKAFYGAFRFIASFIATAGPHFLWVPVNLGIIYGDLSPSSWWWLLLIPSLGIEIAASLFLDARPEGRFARERFIASIAFRLAFIAFFFFVMIGLALDWANNPTPNYFVPLTGFWPWVAKLTLIAVPVLGFILVCLLAGLHLILTVWKRRLRLTTTIILPGLAVMGLFHLWYHFPLSPLLLDPREPDPVAEQVFPFAEDALASGDEPAFFPRDLYVMPDEERFVATTGKTYFPPKAWRNMWFVDLSQQRVVNKIGPVCRRFSSKCPDRLYMSPWDGPWLLEVDPETGRFEQHVLPLWANGHFIEEINAVVHDCERSRVLAANSRNPVIIVWDTRTSSVVRVVNLVETAGLRLGDTIGFIDIAPVTRNVVIGLWAKWDYIELEGESLKPLRFGHLPSKAYELHLATDGRWMYGASAFSGGLWKIDYETFEVVATFDAPPMCRRLETTDDGNVLIALSYLTGEVMSFDTRTTKLIKKYYVGPKAEALYVTKHWVWVFAANGLYRLPLDAMRTDS